MNTIIIYGSCYGTTKVYAEALAEQMGLTAVPYDRTGNLSGYQRIIYLGGLYAGGVKGLVKTVKKIDPAVCGRFVVITVGLADPEDEKNVRNIRASAGKQIPDVYKRQGDERVDVQDQRYPLLPRFRHGPPSVPHDRKGFPGGNFQGDQRADPSERRTTAGRGGRLCGRRLQ